MGKAANKLLIEAVCALTSDKKTLEIAEWAMMRQEGMASKFLHRYLDGLGGIEYVDINTLLREDAGILDAIQEKISSELRPDPPKRRGTVPLPQSKFKNRDWQFATGSINMNWRLISLDQKASTAEVELSFQNEYRWHPDEPRVTQCLHQAAERLRTSGSARNFTMVGQPTKVKITIQRAGATGKW